MTKINLIEVENLTIGFNYRNDTYSGKLAFISYSNNGESLFNNSAFSRWVDKRIPLLKIKNNAVNGFVLSKANLHHLYNRSIGYTRVFHPEGFDFEIPLDNFYYLMQHTLIDRGQINSECRIYFSEDGKPWILNNEAINSNNFIVKKVSGDYFSKNLNIKDLHVGNLIRVNKKRELSVVVETLSGIYAYDKNSSMFYADKYLLDNYFYNNKKLKFIKVPEINNYENISTREKLSGTEMEMVNVSELSSEQINWAGVIVENKTWDLIEWNNRIQNEVNFEEKAIYMMLEHISFPNFKEINLEDVSDTKKKLLAKKSLSNILISNFLLSLSNGLNYRMVITKTKRLELAFKTDKKLPEKDFYIYMVHFGKNELLKRNSSENEVFDETNIIPIASIFGKDIEKENLNLSTSVLISLLRNNGFNL